MPRSGQIIPKYLQPHEEVYINDNTYYEDVTDDNSGPKFLCVFVGGKGRDKLLLKRSFSDFIAEYGYPNYRKWGQAMYMPYTMLFSGNAQCQCLRLTAEDATYANIIIVVGYKQEDAKLKLKFKTYTRTNIRNIDDLEVFANGLETSVPDEEGYCYVPIFTVWALGKGAYGEDFRVRLVHDKNADKENDYKNYNLQLLSTEKGSMMIESYNVTFDIEGTDPYTKLTNYIEEIVNDEVGSGSKRIACQFFSDNYNKLFEQFCEVYENNGYIAPTVQTVDRLPSITLPSNTVLYNLTQADGSKSPGMYVYDTTDGVFNASAFTIQEVTSLPDTGNVNVIYKLTQDYQTTTSGDTPSTVTYATGNYIYNNGAYITAPEIIEVEMLPSTQLYDEDVVYELSRDVGNKAAGSLWMFNSTYNDYVAYVEEDHSPEVENPYTIGTWDMFGYSKFTKEAEPLIVIDGGDESLSIMDLEGIALGSGDDGEFSDNQPASVREAAFDKAYINAFQGVTDKKILSKRRSPVDMILDAGFSVNVKKAIASLVLQRMDCSARLDCGLLTNVDDIYDMGVALGSINTYMVSKNAGMFKTLDPITGKIIPATITLWLASQYPIHYAIYGNHVPLAGENYAVLSGYTIGSIRPEIDADDMDIKEKLLTEYRINYIEALDEDTYVRGTQTTSQVENSDLSEENNVLVLLEIKRKIERLAARNRYSWAEGSDLQMFAKDCSEIFSSYQGTKCRSLNVSASMSTWEETRYIVHIYLEVVFRTFQKRAIIEIDVNPRT